VRPAGAGRGDQFGWPGRHFGWPDVTENKQVKTLTNILTTKKESNVTLCILQRDARRYRDF
jgi:hypothetical protein